ncbi:BMP family lipoprotein [Paenibacillus massiliensis]|uniref:BMP family lipoprotein n=1 Tax=Paenibacillus massiliensis TaxID=225917 RepID=UPI00036D86D0|nr:BMP family ABC transporter substrate-binding protein [Paenibacillus massiliensis]
MKKTHGKMLLLIFKLALVMLLLSACTAPGGEAGKDGKDGRITVGIVLTDVGLGDRSFNDAAFEGLAQERNENSIIFDYREPGKGMTTEEAFEHFAQDKVDLIIGLSDTVKADMEKVAERYPEQTFLIVDSQSELPNVHSILFKAEDGSFLAGIIAGFATKADKVGFLGGMDIPVLRDFQQGFEQGVQAVNPDASVEAVYANDFGNSELGAELASQMINEQGTDVIYVAAGLTGVGALSEIQDLRKHAIGVDTDQFFLAEKAILTSMLKNVDVAMRNAVDTFKSNNNSFPDKVMVYGMAENGVGLTELHNIELTDAQEQQFEDLKAKLASGEVKVNLQK